MLRRFGQVSDVEDIGYVLSIDEFDLELTAQVSKAFVEETYSVLLASNCCPVSIG